MDRHTQEVISFLWNEIDEKMNEQIELVEINKKFPIFVQKDCIFMTFQNINAAEYDPEKNTDTGMVQQKLQQICLLEKDSLMPKGIERESQQIDKVSKMDDASFKNKKKNMNGTRSSFNRSNLHSVSNTQRNSKISQLSKIKRKSQSPFISILQEEQDPEAIASLRKIKQFQWNQKQKQTKMKEKKQKQFLEKQEKFNNELVDKGYTFDFQGDAINSTIEQQKINYYTMKMRLSMADKKLRTNVKFRESQNANEIKIQPSKKLSLKETPSMSIELNPMIPLFEQQSSDPSILFGIPSGKQKCKLKEYKKHYGGRFSRLDKSLNTIDNSQPERNDEYQQLFSERRYLKDEQKSFNQSMISYRTKLETVTRRKLALPKIHGKYSTLDRYQQY